MKVCKQHKRGATIEEMGYWVCGDCYSVLPSKPIKYGAPSPSIFDGPPQVITWQAETTKSVEGLTLNDFLRTAAHRYQYYDRSLSLHEAYGLAIELLETIGENFADPAMEWSHSSAREIVNDDVNEYWEEEPDFENG